MTIHDTIQALVQQFNASTHPEPGATAITKLTDFHNALETSLRTLSLLPPNEFYDPRIQAFIKTTIGLKTSIKTKLDTYHIDEFMKKTGWVR
jgi:hypothetical protein